MNKAILMGRLTRDPDIRYTQGDNPMCIARYTLAVDRRFSRTAGNDGNNNTMFPGRSNAQAVFGVEPFEQFPFGAYVDASVSEGAVHVKGYQPNADSFFIQFIG